MSVTLKKPNISERLKNLPPLGEAQPQQQQVPQQEQQQTTQQPQVEQQDTEEYEGNIQSPQSQTIQTKPKTLENTYLSMGSEEYGFLEIDLVTFREKGKEERYLSIGVNGFNEHSEIVNNVYCAIRNKEEFEQIKQFFANLTWED